MHLTVGADLLALAVWVLAELLASVLAGAADRVVAESANSDE